MAYVWNANFSSSPLCWTQLLHCWGSATQNRSIKRPIIWEAVVWWSSLLQVLVNSQSWICFRKQLNTLVKGKFTSVVRCRYCLCQNSSAAVKGMGGRCMAACTRPLPPHPWVDAGCWTKEGPLKPLKGLVLLWFLSSSADNWRSSGGGSTKLFAMDEDSNPLPAAWSSLLGGIVTRRTFQFTCSPIWHFPWPDGFPYL